MLLAFIQILALVGFVSLLLSWWTGRDEIAMILGIIGTFAWGLCTYGLFDVEKVSNGSVVSVGEFPAIALFTVGLAFITFLPALVEPFELIGSSRDVDDPMERI